MSTNIEDHDQAEPSDKNAQETSYSGGNRSYSEEHEPVAADLSRFNPSIMNEGLLSHKKTPLYLLIICLLLSALTVGMVISITRKSHDNWVYRVQVIDGMYFDAFQARFFDIETSLKGMGYTGWELCSVLPLIETVFPNFGSEEYHTGLKDNTRTRQIVLIFKRRV